MENKGKGPREVCADFLELAAMSWNPDNFDELLVLMRLQCPDTVAAWESEIIDL